MSRQILASQENERKRIASELHDSTAQHVVAATLGLMQLGPSANEAEERTRGEIRASLNEALRELRVFTYLLHPPELRRDGLNATLRAFIEGFGRRTNLCTTLRSSPALDELPQDLQRAVFRVVQEGLSNAYKRARASRGAVRVMLVKRTLFLRIRDNGQGMISGAAENAELDDAPLGVGLPGMRARLKQFGGGLTVRSGMSGTTLLAMVPLALPVQDHLGIVASGHRDRANERIE